MSTTEKKVTPPPAYRVFISSTYTDMIAYREAVQTVITNCDCVAYGMERFVAAPIRPLDRCYEEIAGSQIFILLLGHRYGEKEEESGKSFTELEYEKAKELGLPILAFFLDVDKVGTVAKFRESDDKYQALQSFKLGLKNSKEITVHEALPLRMSSSDHGHSARYDSPDGLRCAHTAPPVSACPPPADCSAFPPRSRVQVHEFLLRYTT